MKNLLALFLLVGMTATLVGCGAGEQEAPKPNPADFTPKAGGPNDGPNAGPKTP